jgi:hypothetical protein
MSLIYGEGSKNAFMRLQKTIMEQSDDHSLFAWRQEQGYAGYGLLASSPDLFADSSTLIRIDYFEPRSAYGMTNRGLEIKLSLTCTLRGDNHFVTLGCAEPYHDGDVVKEHQIGIYVALRDDGRFVRTHLDQLVRIDPDSPLGDYKSATLELIYVLHEELKEEPPQKNYNFRVISPEFPTWKGRTKAFLIPRVRGKIFASAAKAASVGFTLAATTSPGLKSSAPDGVRFGLERGGRVGVLFKPSKRQFANEPESNILEFIVVIFGVNLDGSVYGDIAGIMKNDYEVYIIEMSSESRLRGTSEWFEKYIREYAVGLSTTKVEKIIWDLIFSLRIQLEEAEKDLFVYQVSMSYRSQ